MIKELKELLARLESVSAEVNKIADTLKSLAEKAAQAYQEQVDATERVMIGECQRTAEKMMR